MSFDVSHVYRNWVYVCIFINYKTGGINMEKIVAVAAPFITCIQLVPQVYKTFTTRTTSGLSVHTFILAWITSFLWWLHGYYTLDLSLIVATSVSLFMNTCMLVMLYLF